eukprot:scaffold133126_cov63-Phaeocystis_antarctica.AAC.2
MASRLNASGRDTLQILTVRFSPANNSLVWAAVMIGSPDVAAQTATWVAPRRAASSDGDSGERLTTVASTPTRFIRATTDWPTEPAPTTTALTIFGSEAAIRWR